MIQKSMILRMIGFMFIINYRNTTYALKQSISRIKKYFTLSIYGPKKFPKIPVIQELSIKLMDIWMQGLALHI